MSSLLVNDACKEQIQKDIRYTVIDQKQINMELNIVLQTLVIPLSPFCPCSPKKEII